MFNRNRYILTDVDISGRTTLRNLIIATLGLLIFGTAGFMQISSLSFGDSLYETIIILLTHYDHHGFEDGGSRWLVLFLIISSLLVVAYLLRWFAEAMMGLGTNFRRGRVKAKVDRLKDHYIVCGLGRVGSQVAREMYNEGVPFVGLDRDPAKVAYAIEQGFLAIALDSTDETALRSAGLERATGLVASLGEDSLNLFITLAARSINPELYIVARANRQENEVKLKRAGANRVALPYQIGGYHMASMALRPNVVDYIDVISSKDGTSGLEVEEMVVGDESKLAGHRLGKALADGEIGATVIAINGIDGRSTVRPSGKEIIYAGDRLIILGAKHDLTVASELIR
jgi:voltage-gated potassium channel